jgi:hypothetical protein
VALAPAQLAARTAAAPTAACMQEHGSRHGSCRRTSHTRNMPLDEGTPAVHIETLQAEVCLTLLSRARQSPHAGRMHIPEKRSLV